MAAAKSMIVVPWLVYDAMPGLWHSTIVVTSIRGDLDATVVLHDKNGKEQGTPYKMHVDDQGSSTVGLDVIVGPGKFEGNARIELTGPAHVYVFMRYGTAGNGWSATFWDKTM
ncbi:MAG: hypothetical protein IT372_26095 [Polyangiaceae bacterium]|nr:hypothetical protein [Polyangiaceae bacterium]